MKTSLLLGILFARDGPTFTKKIIETICNIFVASNCGSIVTKFSRVCCFLSFFVNYTI